MVLLFCLFGSALQAMKNERVPLWQKALFGSTSVGLVCVGTYSLYKNGFNYNNSAFLPALSSIVGGLVTSIAGAITLNHIQKCSTLEKRFDESASDKLRFEEENVTLKKNVEMLRDQNGALLEIKSQQVGVQGKKYKVNKWVGVQGKKYKANQRVTCGYVKYKSLLRDLRFVCSKFSSEIKGYSSIKAGKYTLVSNHIDQDEICYWKLQDWLQAPPYKGVSEKKLKKWRQQARRLGVPL